MWLVTRFSAEFFMHTDILVSFQGYNVVSAWRSTHISSASGLALDSLGSYLVIPFPWEISNETRRGNLWWHHSQSGLDTAIERGGGRR